LSTVGSHPEGRMFIVGCGGYAKTWEQPFGEERAVTSEQRLRELEEKYEGYKVYDNRGDKIGKVDDLFVDESDNEEYIGVKLGLFGTKSTLIPMEIVRVNEAEKAIEVSDSKDHVQDAPTFGDDDEVTAEYEDRIRSHFGLESLASSSSSGGYGANSGTSSGTDYDSEESSASSSGTSTEYRGEGESREDATTAGQDYRTDDDSSSVDTQYGERTGSSTTSSTSGETDYDQQRSESSSGTAAGSSGVSAQSSRTGESTGDQESSGTPASRRTEETETVEEGGRTKVRRRIVREEIIEEEPDS
jgi:sporulation protein YlmC with PRC-barrel domain